MIWQKMAAKIKERSGFSLLHILAAALIIGVLAIPMAKWFMSTAGNIGTDQEKASAQTEKMEMQSIIQNYWQKMVDMSYDEFQAEIAAKGTKRTETLSNYNLTIEFSGDSQYANALCNVGTAAGASDRHCRRANITLVSKRNPSMVESFQATRVQPASLESKLLKLAKDLEDQGGKFKDYDTKTEADNKYACPWDYKMNAAKTACVACDAPSNWKQYRSGNCTLGTCPTGKKANAAKTGCEAITCSGRTKLDGDTCKSCPLSGKQYYTSSSGCSTGTCGAHQKVNSSKTGCEACTAPSGNKQYWSGDCSIGTCPTGQRAKSDKSGCEAIPCTAAHTHLVGDSCVACTAPSGNKQYWSGNCSVGTCPTGQRANKDKTGCETIPCGTHEHLVGDTCTSCTAPSGNKQYWSGNCSVGSCPTGQKANSDRSGCTPITCPSGKILNGDSCEDTQTTQTGFVGQWEEAHTFYCDFNDVDLDECEAAGNGYYSSSPTHAFLFVKAPYEWKSVTIILDGKEYKTDRATVSNNRWYSCSWSGYLAGEDVAHHSLTGLGSTTGSGGCSIARGINLIVMQRNIAMSYAENYGFNDFNSTKDIGLKVTDKYNGTLQLPITIKWEKV